MTPRPLFVIGLARSGTNLLARMLDAHPKVSISLDPYMPVFRALRDALIQHRGSDALRRRYGPGLPFQDYYFDPLAAELLDLMRQGDLDLPLAPGEIERLRAACADRAALESPALGQRMTALTGDTFAQLLQSMLAVLAEEKPGACWVGCKEVWVEDFVPLLAKALPDARFVIIERDPRAIIGSLLAVAEQDDSQAAHAPSYMRHWRKGIALNRYNSADPALTQRMRVVAYEDLASDPEKWARLLCDDLGLDYTQDMIDLSADGWTGNSGYRHDGRNVYSGSLERWRKTLPLDVVKAIDLLCGPEMRLTRYRPIEAPRLTPDVLGYLRRAGTESGSWRSDSGDLFADLSGEALRLMFLDCPEGYDEALLRRAFLFPEIFHAIRRTGGGEGERV